LRDKKIFAGCGVVVGSYCQCNRIGRGKRSANVLLRDTFLNSALMGLAVSMRFHGRSPNAWPNSNPLKQVSRMTRRSD